MGEQVSFKNWITDGSGHCFYTRKSFFLKKKPQRAIVYVTGLGQFNFYVNGTKIGDHVLDPAWTDYRKIVYYLTFDVTEALREGENVFAAEVGNGWYLADQSGGYFFHFPSFMPPNPNPYRPFGTELVFGLHARLDDLIIDTDESWKTAPHPVLHSNCYGSEIIDGKCRIENWNQIDLDDRNWEKARYSKEGQRLNSLLAEQKIPGTRVIRTYTGRLLGIVHGRSIYDFGQNCSGMLSFEVKGRKGEEVHAYPAEKLTEDGDVDQMAKNWLPIDVKETCILGNDEEWESFCMTFTYFGGRYVAFDCDPEQLRSVRLHAISSAGRDAGHFSCDDERYMRIYELVNKSVEANIVGVHTDCPTIERFAWQEENHLMAPAIMYMKDVKKHWEKFLTDTRLAQLTKDDWFYDMKQERYYPGDGLIPSQAPCYIPNVLPVPGLGDFYNIIGWGSSIILGTYWHYQFYGDQRIIEENYKAGKKYLGFLKTCVNSEGFINHGLGDWGNPDREYAKENVETAFLYADAKVLQYFAEEMGKSSDAEEFASYAEQVKNNYNEKLLAKNPKTGRYAYRVWKNAGQREGGSGENSFTMTQAAEAMPLFWKMVPEDKEKDVADSFRMLLEQDGCLRTGEVGQPYIIQSMNRYGMSDLLCEMILRPEHPSYYAFVKAGETTLGEYWEENPRSHCHDMMGHIIEWYYNGIAGIRPLEPGFRKVLIHPYLPLTMKHMTCSYQSASGRIEVELNRKTDGEVDLQVYADPGIDIQVDKSGLK